MFNFLTQLIGFIALILLLIVYQKEKRPNILLLKLLSSIFYAIHFALLGAWTGSAMNVVATSRSYVFQQRTKKKLADNKIWLFGFLVIIILSTAFTWEGNHSLLPMIGTLIYTFAFWMKNERWIRLLSLVGIPFWMIYNVMVNSFAGIIAQVFLTISILIGIIRFDKKR